MTFRRERTSQGKKGSASRGSVTAETAAMLPALMVVLAAALWAIQAVGAQLECVDAARAAARAAARGEPLDQVRDLARSATRPDAQIDVTRNTATTKVQITVEVRPAWGQSLPAVRVSATASAATEPSTTSSPEGDLNPSPEGDLNPSPEGGPNSGPEDATDPYPEVGTSPSPEGATDPSPEDITNPYTEVTTNPNLADDINSSSQSNPP
ncbi:TadE family type IV pilus minor pilin [Nonomuraea sp. B12E4]|uniref:TadE family type IV pilus minor pilin n=1 Tax=Nonomuraea sp. B12E4 TaxID=3153564 RepID=UPI00325F0E4B